MTKQEIQFDKDKTLVLVSEDMFFQFILRDLKTKGHSEVKALEVIFNSNIIGDSVYEEKYQKI